MARCDCGFAPCSRPVPPSRVDRMACVIVLTDKRSVRRSAIVVSSEPQIVILCVYTVTIIKRGQSRSSGEKGTYLMIMAPAHHPLPSGFLYPPNPPQRRSTDAISTSLLGLLARESLRLSQCQVAALILVCGSVASARATVLAQTFRQIHLYSGLHAVNIPRRAGPSRGARAPWLRLINHQF